MHSVCFKWDSLIQLIVLHLILFQMLYFCLQDVEDLRVCLHVVKELFREGQAFEVCDVPYGGNTITTSK